MGLFAKIKELFSAQKYIFSAMAEMDRKNSTYINLTTEELGALNDDELISAALYRTDKKIDNILGKKKKGTPADWSEHLTGAQRIVYILSYFESDMQTGGLEYFLERNDALASLVSECLGEIGALEQRALYDEFLADRGYRMNYSERLEYQEELRAFNDRYLALPAMEQFFATYLKTNIEQF